MEEQKLDDDVHTSKVRRGIFGKSEKLVGVFWAITKIGRGISGIFDDSLLTQWSEGGYLYL